MICEYKDKEICKSPEGHWCNYRTSFQYKEKGAIKTSFRCLKTETKPNSCVECQYKNIITPRSGGQSSASWNSICLFLDETVTNFEDSRPSNCPYNLKGALI
jgi:hypothetical protein